MMRKRVIGFLTGCLFGVLSCGLALAAHNPNPPQPSDDMLNKMRAALPEKATKAPAKPRKILVFWRCEGFFHSSIPLATQAFKAMGEKTGAFSVDVSDDMNVLTAENLAKYDGLLFNNTTMLEPNEAQQKAILDFVKSGKGIIGVHAASDNFYKWKEGAEMIGATFDGHPWTSEGTWPVKLDEPDHVLLKGFDHKGFLLKEELYQPGGPYSRAKLRILVSMDMDHPDSRKPDPKSIKRVDLDEGLVWIHKVEKGRVFYSGFGHNEDIFWNKAMLQQYLDGIQYALGDYEMDDRPSDEVSPRPEPTYAEGSKGAFYRNVALIGENGLSVWRQPTGEWQVFGDAVTDPQNEKALKGAEGKGVIVNGPKGSTNNLLSNLEHWDVMAHVEFKVPKGSNSGVYFMGRYEIQVFDSFGIEKAEYPGAGCGGIYQRWANDKGFEGHDPLVNASKPAGEWQSYDVVFRAPRFDASGKKTENARFVRVVQNGKVIHENVEVTGPTRAAAFEDEKSLGPLMLQGDHGPVAYRNVTLRVLAEDPKMQIMLYDFGSSRAAMAGYEERIRKASPEEKGKIEEDLIGMLDCPLTTYAAKQWVCRMLRNVGTAKSVPSLAKLLPLGDYSHMARFALQGMACPEAGEALLAALAKSDGAVKVGILGTLGQRGDGKAVAAVADALKGDASKDVKRAAIQALGRMGGEAAAEALKAAQVDADLKDEKSNALLMCADKLPAEKAVEICKSLMAAENPKTIRIAAHAGLAKATGVEAVPALMDLLKSDDKGVRLAAGQILASIPGDKAGQAIAEALAKVDPASQLVLVTALSARGQKSAAPEVAKLVASENEEVRIAALHALGELGGVDQVDGVAAKLSDTGETGKAAEAGLARMAGKDTGAKIVAVAEAAQDAGVKARLIAVLGDRQQAEAVPALVKMLDDKDANAVKAVGKALGKIAGAKDAAPLAEIVATAADAKQEAAAEALKGLAARDTEAKAGAVVPSVEKANPRGKELLMPALARLGGDEALGAVRKALGSDNVDVRKAAIRALSDWREMGPVVEDLQKSAQGDADGACKILALNGFVKAIEKSGKPAPEQVGLYKKALELATRVEEKRAVVSALGNVADPGAKALVEPFLKDEALKQEAQNALDKINKGGK
ncbi:MAG TPA: ThuA domain-containing protein [Candidatus Sumerlaeota bacterium]|nr:ThuA domain-containing protein [Candidatus Sumerlaeota bacterium]